MILKVYSVFDSKMAAFSRPFYSLTDAVAIRAFTDDLNAADSPLYKHCEDYSLFYLGDFDDKVGTFDTVNPVNLVTASALVASRSKVMLPPEVLDSVVR